MKSEAQSRNFDFEGNIAVRLGILRKLCNMPNLIRNFFGIFQNFPGSGIVPHDSPQCCRLMYLKRPPALRLIIAMGIFVIESAAFAQTPPSVLPTEMDSVGISHTVILTNVQGGIFKKEEGGGLVPVASGGSVEPGDVLLVLRGASFSIGGTTFGPESHGDRWVRFQ